MQLSLIIIRKYQLNQPRADFKRKLRSKTREPYFDNRNARRLDVEDPEGTIYANEFDTIISLRNEVISERWMVFKTLILFRKKYHQNYFWTISYPGHYATLMTIFTLIAIIAGIYQLFTNENYTLLPISIVSYLLILYLSKEDYESHHLLIKECCGEKK